MNDTLPRPRRLRRLLLIVLVAVLLMVVIALTAGRGVLEKLLTDLAMPMGWIWLMLSWICLVLAVRREGAFKWAALAWLVCTLAGNGLLADTMVATLENRYADVRPLEHAPLQRVAVLGGGTGQAANGQVQVAGSGDRVVLAARMYHRGLAEKIICTGTGIASLHGKQLVAGQAARRILIDLDVPPEAIEVIGGRNTSEEMKQLEQLVGTQPIGIITSAWHLPRAIRLADKQGLKAVPLPADFRSGPADEPRTWGQLLRDCIPSASAMDTNSRVFKEYLAWLVGR